LAETQHSADSFGETMSKAERRKAKKEARRASRALVPYSPKIPVEIVTKSAHIRPETEADKMALTFAEPIEETVVRPDWKPVTKSVETLPRKPLETNAVPVNATREAPRRVHRGLVLAAYGFFLASVGIIIRNVWGASPADVALFATWGVLAEAVMFWLPAWAMTLPLLRRAFAFALLILLVWPFALTNNLRLASIVAADTAQARMDRIDPKLDRAQAAIDAACDTKKPTVACQQRIAAAKALAKPADAIASQARPETRDFRDLIAWASFGLVRPSDRDFDLLSLLFRTLLPQIGGVVLLLARR
jgi:hypothetical protein